jgi:hypothetical protein
MAQQIRRSQFLTVYGPGAILEGPDGPRVIPTLQGSEVFTDHNPVDFEITDLRMSRVLLNGAGIVRVPSNAELGLTENDAIYRTHPFPSWALCVQHGILYLKTTPDNRACPFDPPLANIPNAWRRVRMQAIRFVRVCPKGHLDDVDWGAIINHNNPGCRPHYLRWQGGGGALRNINIVCPECGGRVNLGYAYSRPWHCSGRFPELGKDRPGCDAPAKILQRGAANLRIPEVKTALTIPPRSTNLHRLLEGTALRTALHLGALTKQALLDAAAALPADLLPPRVIVELRNFDEVAVAQAIRDILDAADPASIEELRLEEFKALRNAAANGAPVQPPRTPWEKPQFEVRKSLVRSVKGPSGRTLRITPVNRLRVVMVQVGYRRVPTGDPLEAQLVERTFDHGGRLWYPGVELFGEGIFIDLDPGPDTVATARHFPMRGQPNEKWFLAWIDPDEYEQRLRPGERDQLHPVFVWWHTLAHRIINALAVDSGYASASVRERVFIQTDSDGNAGGGILLYTAQPGGDGTLGGLIALAADFESVLGSAFRYLDACSNDPLCGDERFDKAKYNGAACYACALVSETSCEHRNMRLDRNLLLDNLP